MSFHSNTQQEYDQSHVRWREDEILNRVKKKKKERTMTPTLLLIVYVFIMLLLFEIIMRLQNFRVVMASEIRESSPSASPLRLGHAFRVSDDTVEQISSHTSSSLATLKPSTTRHNSHQQQQQSNLYQIVRQVSVTELTNSNNGVIVGGFNYYSIFIWKKFSQIQSLQDLVTFVQTHPQDFWKVYGGNPISNSKRKFKILCPQLYPCQKIWTLMTAGYDKKLIDELFVVEPRSNLYPDCMAGSSLEIGDALLLTSYDFALYVRVNAVVTRKSLFQEVSAVEDENAVMYHPGDFTPIPLFPSEVLIYVSLPMTQPNSKPFIDFVTARTDFSQFTSCNSSRIHDMYILDRVHGVLNFTESDIRLIEQLQGGIKLTIDQSLLSSLVSTQYAQFLQPLSIQNATNLLWNSTCHFCGTRLCLAENIDNGDIMLFAYAIPCLIFYFVFFAFGMYKKPALRKRLLVPYLTPFCIFATEVLWTSLCKNSCRSILVPVSILFSGYGISVYVLVAFRFLFIKNLYKLIKNAQGRKLTFFKWLASEKVGWTLITIIPLFFMILFILPSMFAAIFDLNNLVFINNVFFSILTGFGCGLGVLYSFIDLFANRKLIKEKGIGRYLFFDDPFHIRIDMLAFMLQVFLAILFLVITPANQTQVGSNIIRMLIAIWLLFTSGGFAMMIEIYNMIRARHNSKKTRSSIEQEQGVFEYLLTTNVEFALLFKEYSKAESSIENYYLFERLMEIKKSGRATLTQFQDIEQKFIRQYSLYEINMQHRNRLRFYELLHAIENNKTNQQEFKVRGENVDPNVENIWQILMTETIYNMWDTYSRLQILQQYRNWALVYEIHAKQALDSTASESLNKV
nr:unnamed protein product [Naegleria fowleri]